MVKYHYVYRIHKKKHYYGSRTSKKQPDQDLGILYFSSSSDVDFIKDQKTNQHNYKYVIVRCFDNRKDATEFEILLHNKFGVAKNINFYNKSEQTSTGFLYGMLGKKHPELSRKKSAKKASETMRKIMDNGLTIRENAINKKVKTMKENINENGETAYNVCAQKGNITKQNTILENGLNIHQNAIEKWKETLDNVKEGELMSTRDKLKQPKKDKTNYQKDADKINIFDDKNNLVWKVNIPLKRFCEEYNLPYTAFYKSKKENVKLYENINNKQVISILKNKGYYKYKGWRAIHL